MATKVSDTGLTFISSWSAYSDTVYKVERNLTFEGKYLGFFDGSVLSSLSAFNDAGEIIESTTQENALSCLRSHLNRIVFKLLTDFGFEKFNQTQFDAVVSLLTLDSRESDFYDHFKSTDLYTALKTDVSDPSVPGLITNYVGNTALSNSGAFYNFADRRTAESTLFSSGVYNNCPSLVINEKEVDGIKVLY